MTEPLEFGKVKGAAGMDLNNSLMLDIWLHLLIVHAVSVWFV